MKLPRRFFEYVFGDALERGKFDIEFRCLGKTYKNDPLWPEHIWVRHLKELKNEWIAIEDHNLSGYDIHYTVLPRLRKFQGKKEHPLPDMLVASCVYADLDVGERKPHKRKIEALCRIRDAGPNPNIIVESGTGLHPYWLVKPCEVTKERFERLLRTISTKLDGDSGAARATRLMRVPNTYNWKYEDGKLAKARFLSKIRYRFEDLEALWNVDEDDSGTNEGSQPATYAKLFADHLNGFRSSRNSAEATALCPFHPDKHPSFSVNLDTGLWKCHSSKCRAKGNLEQFWQRLKVPSPKGLEVRRFPRLRTITADEELTTEAVFEATHKHIISQIHFTQSWQPVVVALWAMGTYLHMQFPCYGHLWLNSPTTHSGKSKLLSVLWTVCYKALEPQLEPTSAALFRFPSVIGGTLLLDEVDNLDPQKRSEVIAILNHYNSNGVVVRATPGKNKKFTLEKLPVYCPKVIAGINNLPTTLQDRCIKIFLHRKSGSEVVKRFMPGSFEALEPLRNQLDAWSVRDALRILAAYRDHGRLGIPSNVDDRARDILEPLFAISTVLPKWVRDKLVDAAESIAKDRNYEEQESNTVVQGLQILKERFPEGKRVWSLRTEDAVELFSEEIEAVETRGQAQALLRKLGFRSKRSRYGKRVLRAYQIPRKRLERMLARYGLREHAA
jgi:hypothetical protein